MVTGKPEREGSDSRSGSSFGPLHGIRVLDLAGGPGTPCGRLLADAGADVIKIEPPSGDPLRWRSPFKGDIPSPEHSLAFLHNNGNKRGITLNLNHHKGRELFLELSKNADVVLETFSLPELNRLGIGDADMEKINPRLVRVSITHFGKSGPYVAFAANDFICLALGGLMSISGEPDKAPLVAPGELAYALASSYAAFGTTVALFHSLSSGRGQLVEVSVHEASALIAGYAVPIYTATGVKPFRQSWRKRLFDLYDVYPAKDGFARIFVVPKNHWQSLLDWLGRPPELTSELFNDQKLRWENSEVIDPFVERLTRQYAKEMLFHEAQRRHIAASPVNTPKEFAKSAQVKAREFFTTVTHPKVGTHVQTRPIHRYNGFPIQPARPAPTLGEHNTEVYETILNLPRKELRLLRMDGVI